MLESLFKACNFIKKRHQHKYFPMNITKVLRIPIVNNICELLLLKVAFNWCNHCERSQKCEALFDEHILACRLNAGIYRLQPEIQVGTQPKMNFHSILYELQYYMYTLKLLGSVSVKNIFCVGKNGKHATRCR